MRFGFIVLLLQIVNLKILMVFPIKLIYFELEFEEFHEMFPLVDFWLKDFEEFYDINLKL